MKTAAGKSRGSPLTRICKASTPPAEVPMTTMSWPDIQAPFSRPRDLWLLERLNTRFQIPASRETSMEIKSVVVRRAAFQDG
jgi:hypothetical protein